MKTVIGMVGMLAGMQAALAQQPVSSGAQKTQCPYNYLSLVLYGPDAYTQYVSFHVSYQGRTRLACTNARRYLKFIEASRPGRLDPERRFLDRAEAIPSPVPFDSLQFEWAGNDARVAQVARQGEKYFLAYYFNQYGCLLSEKGVNAADVMPYLQRWCIVAHQDDETGCLVVDSKVMRVR
ncbi:hypothetical protein EJV47_08355 [Hymenobacter gummosus]|uniref:Uncharacterized protein n=1 Tax=Hymenobacter gummosus TaxID=1776032 RepID=A0A431U3X6_9BACT|nr:hypothetical protein [Hymenobacter gummosus]RTQ50637.1 hypothetical protein EJV47_08355 [Hymenobacter gummosus]